MKKIDTTKWKEFLLRDFFDFQLSLGDNKANELPDGEIPLVSSGAFNNGIVKRIAHGDGKSEMFQGNLITIDMFGKAFYQEVPFYAVSHGRVNILSPKFQMTPNIAKFICSVIDSSFGRRYAFQEMCSQKELLNEQINLPIDSLGKPNWEYMEQYMQSVEIRVNASVSALNALLGGG